MDKKARYVAVREILVVNPFQAKKKTMQRALLWQAIAMNLKQLEDPKFKETLSKRSVQQLEDPKFKETLSKRSVQDRCSLLCEKYKKRMNYEKRASGIAPELTELDVLIEETIEKQEVSEDIWLTQGNKIYLKLNINKY